MKSVLPFILIILLLTGAITYSLSKRVISKIDTLPLTLVPSPTASITPSVTLEITPTPTKAAEIKVIELPVTSTEKAITTKGGTKATQTVIKTTKTTICTPVYGQANTCTEHVVVDTGAEDVIFFNFAGFAYLAGLMSFIKAKRA